ncbi:glycoside hydrolase family 3 C-terminal domain-containing protein [Isoptericola sp. NPDC019571]|uniref:glycoside hydrolase family 3 C-terminal domain-containing protein n=1 Tax=Isoptericola sp. NPDC019571 TaxID=3364008 RepID=UPI0037AC5434
MDDARDDIVSAVSVLVGADMSSTRPGAGHPRLVLADGPSGLAMNLPDFSGKIPATSFPAPVALAATWNVDLIEKVGAAIGAEARAAGAHVLLGPSVNLKRSPLGGRNFEYYSEDPHMSGRAGAAFVRGVQSQGVGACVKHYAVNSQETDRMRVSAEVSERALRELYLAAFEHIVTETDPAMVMASYNRVNGVYASQHPWLLTQVLREEWGFGGAIVSDWGAVDDPVAAVAAGLDLQMPGPSPATKDAIVAAVRAGELDRRVVDQAAARLAAVARRWGSPSRPDPMDRAAHEGLARRVASESFVLLRNEDATLPLAGSGRLLVVGELAMSPRRGGGGSADVAAEGGDTPLQALADAWAGRVDFEPGYRLDSGDDPSLRPRAVKVARRADAVIVVVGSVPGSDSEGYDRDTLGLPDDQAALVADLVATGTSTTVVVNAGGVVDIAPWHEQAGAVLMTWLPGCAGGAALADVLLGAVNPSGKLTETYPLAVEDTPAWPGFPATDHRALHGEGVLVGYRWYDSRGKDVAYPFGHGLTYTTFAYNDLEVEVQDPERVTVRFTLTNTGPRSGAEAWQVYVGDPVQVADREVRRLAAFGKLELAPGESREIEAVLDRRSFARWSDASGTWVVSKGRHEVWVGASSRDLRGRELIDIDGDPSPAVLTSRSTLREWLEHPTLGPRLKVTVANADPDGATTRFLGNPVILTMIGDMPIHRLFGDPANVLSSVLLDEVSADAPPVSR